MRYYLDENIPVPLARMPSLSAVEILTTVAAGNRKASDGAQLEWAGFRGFCLVTQDLGFIELSRAFAARGDAHAGVLLLTAAVAESLEPGAKALLHFHQLYPDGVPPYTVLYAGASGEY